MIDFKYQGTNQENTVSNYQPFLMKQVLCRTQ